MKMQKKKPVFLGDYNISIFDSKSNNISDIEKGNLLFPIKTKVKDNSKKKKLGEIYNKNPLKVKSSLFSNIQEFLVIKQK